jgi:hypothetical protein
MTRREQFDKRQRKWARRRKQMNSHNGAIYISKDLRFGHGGGKVWERVELGLQEPLRIKGKRTSRMDPENRDPRVLTRVDGGGFGTPPHGVMFGPYVEFMRAKDYHAANSFVGLHRRAVMKCGRKLNRMDGAARRIMGATWFCLENFYWPDWDPLQRHPTGQEVDDGADFVEIEWRPGVLGYYP